jgi:hypothetical protein
MVDKFVQIYLVVLGVLVTVLTQLNPVHAK